MMENKQQRIKRITTQWILDIFKPLKITSPDDASKLLEIHPIQASILAGAIDAHVRRERRGI